MRDGFHSNDRSLTKMNTGKMMYYLRIQVLLVDGGPMVLRKIFDEKTSPLAACLKQHQGTLAFLSKRNIINKQQYVLLSSNAPTSASFDISLLSCLLRNICGLQSSTDPCWSTPPAPTDFSIEADLVRFRAYRNEFAHTSSTSALTENDFNTKWTDIVQVLIRLNSHLQNGVPNLQLELVNMKTVPLDEEAEKRYQQEIDKWQQMDSAQTRAIEIMANEIKDLSANIETLSVENRQQWAEMLDKQDEVIKEVKNVPQNKHFSSPEQKHLHDSSQMYFDDAKGKMEYYVRTNIYKEASQQLQTSGIAILSGHPGDGKTVMANCLLMEMAHESKLLRLTSPKDWKLVDLGVYTAVLIDDIFGNAVLDETLLKKWQRFLSEIRMAANQKKLSFVITTRHYIMQEAKEKLQNQADMFNNENVTMLISSRLSPEEKYKILQSHLIKNGREIETNSYMHESIETQWKRVTRTSNKVLTVGFPECASMFASSDILFNKGIEFFSSPLEFFQKCIQDISKDEDEFMPLVLVWVKTPGKFAINNFNIGDNKNQLQELGEEFGYPFHMKKKEIKKCLESHRDEFLVFSTKTGEYSFSHSVISDVVGIVCAREYTDAILKHASKDFIMKYVKTLPCCKDDLIIYIEEYQFNGLIEKFNQLLHMTEDDTQGFLFDNDFFIKPRVDGIENTIICSHFLMSNSVLKHDAFENKDFIKKFVENARVKGGQDKRVNKTLVYAFEILKSRFCITFDQNEMGMCLPSILLAKKNDLLVQECLNKSVLNENEKYISLLLATRDRNKYLVQKLVRHGVKANEDALQIATVNEDIEMLEYLLQNHKGSDSPSHIQHGNRPLITAAKRGSVDLAECLLRSGVDVNYRNNNNVSALDKAVIWNQVDMCRVLLNHGATVNVKGGKFQRTPLHIAADMGHADLVTLLLNNEADVNIRDHKNDYPCQSAAVLGHSKILKEILEKDIYSGASQMSHNFKPISKGMSLYHIAVVKDNQSILRVLKEVGVDPNMKDKYGRTALYLAAVYGKTALVQLLLDVADPNVSEKNGYTPLHAAVYKEDLEIVQLLSNRQQVIINLPDKRGYTPLHLACKTANYDIIVELLKVRQADVRMMTKKGETVLHILKASTRRTKNVSKCLEAIQQTDPFFVEQSGIGISFDNYEYEN